MISTICRILAVLLLSAGAAPDPAQAPAPSRPASSAYHDLLVSYRSGRFDAAVIALGELKEETIAREVKALSAAASRAASDEWLRVAAMLHAEAAIAARDRGALQVWARHQTIARRFIETIQARDARGALPRTWWLLIVSYLEAQGDLAAAAEQADRARDLGGGTPELLLALGAAHETGWTWQHEGDRKSSLKADINQAERLYGAALDAQPDLVEARVRLGRVLTLRGDVDGALHMLEGVRESGDIGFLYLARLFEADALERRGNAAEAERRYSAAIAVMPAAQSGHMALAHVRHAQGARIEAAEEVRTTAADAKTRDAADPWFWYSRGVAWRFDGYLWALRAMVVQR